MNMFLWFLLLFSGKEIMRNFDDKWQCIAFYGLYMLSVIHLTVSWP